MLNLNLLRKDKQMILQEISPFLVIKEKGEIMSFLNSTYEKGIIHSVYELIVGYTPCKLHINKIRLENTENGGFKLKIFYVSENAQYEKVKVVFFSNRYRNVY